MRYLIILEQTEAGFAVQVPDLAIVTYGASLEEAKRAACDAIQINLEAYQEAGQDVPARQDVTIYLADPALCDVLFTYVEVPAPEAWRAA